MNLLGNYFKWGVYLHCEGYTVKECCKKFPCISYESLYKEVFGDSYDINILKLFIQKSHDLQNEVSIDNTLYYLVQIRDPAQAAIAHLRWEIENGKNISIGDVLSELNKNLIYFIKFYHKWVFESKNNDNKFVIKYESLAETKYKTKKMLCDFLYWANLEIVEDRLIYAIDKTLSLDAHTGEKRELETHSYSLEYYNDISGGVFQFLLEKVAAFCPEFTYEYRWDKSLSLAKKESLDDLFIPINFISSNEINIDFSVHQKLNPEKLTFSHGQSLFSPSMGISFFEKGVGAWTDGDVVFLPFKVSALAQTIRGQLIFLNINQINLSKLLKTYAVVEGLYFPIETNLNCEIDQNVMDFQFVVPGDLSKLFRDGCIILKFLDLHGFYQGEPRKLGLLLKNLFITTDLSNDS